MASNIDQASALNKTNQMNQSQLLNMSSLSAFNPEGMCFGGGAGRHSVGPAPSDMGQSIMPYLSVEMSAAEA